MDLHADDPGRLVLREVLGKGGHGVVFRGTMHTLEVAIKVRPASQDESHGGIWCTSRKTHSHFLYNPPTSCS